MSLICDSFQLHIFDKLHTKLYIILIYFYSIIAYINISNKRKIKWLRRKQNKGPQRQTELYHGWRWLFRDVSSLILRIINLWLFSVYCKLPVPSADSGSHRCPSHWQHWPCRKIRNIRVRKGKSYLVSYSKMLQLTKDLTWYHLRCIYLISAFPPHKNCINTTIVLWKGSIC